MTRLLFTTVIVLGASTLCAPPAAGAQRPARDLDLFWTRPGFDPTTIESIAMLPCASFNADLSSEKLVEGLIARTLRTSGHRWVSTSLTRPLLRAAAPDDSLGRAVRGEILQSARVDSATAPDLCRMFRTDAVLCLRVDRWDQFALEPSQSGKSSTTVTVKAALVDSSGRLLWSVSGSETKEGPYQSPGNNPYQTPGGEATLHATGAQMPPPTYEETATSLFDRWADRFPRRPEVKNP